jgi:hypothetical protein
MSLGIIKKNSSSPFLLQRSIVSQDGEGGVYEQGGYNPDMVYNNDSALQSIVNTGKVIGAALSSRTEGQRNADDIKTRDRLDAKSERLNNKKDKSTDENQKNRLDKRITRIDDKSARYDKKINEYNDDVTHTLKSDIKKIK